jgi:hypothetical protein
MDHEVQAAWFIHFAHAVSHFSDGAIDRLVMQNHVLLYNPHGKSDMGENGSV